MVCLVLKNGAPVHASVQHVIEAVREVQSQRSRHRRAPQECECHRAVSRGRRHPTRSHPNLNDKNRSDPRSAHIPGAESAGTSGRRNT